MGACSMGCFWILSEWYREGGNVNEARYVGVLWLSHSFVVAFGPLWFIMGLFGFCTIECFYLVGQIMTFCHKSKEVQDSLYIGKKVAIDFDLLISWEIIKVKVTFGFSYKGKDAFFRSQRVGESH